MILIDAIYINSLGGLTILKTLLNGLKENQSINYDNFHFLLDERVDKALLPEIKISLNGIGNIVLESNAIGHHCLNLVPLLQNFLTIDDPKTGIGISGLRE